MPLGIFASKSVSTSKNLAAWLPSSLAAKKASATVLQQPYCMASGMTLWFVRLYEYKDSIESSMKKTKYSLL